MAVDLRQVLGLRCFGMALSELQQDPCFCSALIFMLHVIRASFALGRIRCNISFAIRQRQC